jgi:hypothetical protein
VPSRRGGHGPAALAEHGVRQWKDKKKDKDKKEEK